MKNLLTKNLGWKIGSLLIAIIVWILVTTINNPSTSQSYYNIPVELKNTNMITDSGRVFEILDGSNIISKVTIKAPRSIISEIDEDDIVATADVKDISSLDTVSIQLTTKNFSEQLNSIVASSDVVKLNIENKKSKTLSLSTQILGKVGDGYIVSEVKTDQNLVRLTGAESKINSVASALVEIDVTGFTTDIGTNAEIKLFDKEGRQVSNEGLTQNIRNVGVHVTILETKEVPVRFTVENTAAQGYSTTGQIDTNKPSVLLAGKPNALKSIEAIDIPEDVIDVSEQRSDFTVTVNIRNYIPDGVVLVDSTDSMFDVTVHIEPQIGKRIPIEIQDVHIRNVPDDLRATVSIEANTVLEVIGLADEVNSLNGTNVGAHVDVTRYMNEQGIKELPEGFYSVPVYFGLSDRITILDPIQATLHIVKKTDSDE